MSDGTGNVPEVPVGSQLRSLTRTPMHSPLTSHRKGLIQGAAGSTGREYNLSERPGGHRNLVRSGNSVRGSDSGCRTPHGRRSDVLTPRLTPSVSRRSGAGTGAGQQPREGLAHPNTASVGINGNYGARRGCTRAGRRVGAWLVWEQRPPTAP